MAETTTAHAAPSRKTLIAFGALIVAAGGNAVGIRYTNEELAPFWGATLRFGAAAAIFLAIALARRVEFPRGRALAGATMYGVLGFGGAYAFAYWALIEVSAGVGQIILGLVPLLTVLLAAAQGIEMLRARAVLGTLLALSGIALVFAASATGGTPLLPLAAVVAGALCIAQSSIVVKRSPPVDPLAMNAIGMGVGVLVLLAASIVAREPWSPPRRSDTWAALLYLVLVGSVLVFALFLYVLRRWTASATSYLFVLTPFVTVVLGAILRGERLTLLHAAGGALALAGVYLGALSGPHKAPPSSEMRTQG